VAALIELAPSTARLDVSVVTTEAGFDAVREEWNRLVDGVEDATPFQTWEWNHALWRHFPAPQGHKLKLALFRDGERLAAILPFVERRRSALFQELSPIGWRDRLTEQLDLIVASPDRGGVLAAAQEWLFDQRWTWAGLPQLREGDRISPESAAHVAEEVRIVFEHHVLPDSWEALDRGLNKSMRDNVRYYPRLMVREGHSFELETASTPEAVSAALPVLYELHAARAAALTSIRHLDYLKRPKRRAFLGEVLPQLAARGEARIGLLRVRGEAVAAQMWLEKSGAMLLYYSGFLPEWSKYSVAMVCTSEIFKDAMARGLRRVEFLRGANHWKSRWGTEERVEREVVLARRPALVRARFAYLKQWKHQRRRIARHLPWRPEIPE